jgi:hypothetical protein
LSKPVVRLQEVLMRFPDRIALRVSACLFLLVAFSSPVFANRGSDRTQVGHDITIGPNEEVSDATCFGCSVRVRGHVASDVTVFGGSIVVEEQGRIAGEAVAFGGGIRLDRGARVDGDVTVLGGQVRFDPAASVGGDVTNFGGGSIWLFLIFGLPVVLLGGIIALIVWIVRRLTRPSLPATA